MGTILPTSFTVSNLVIASNVRNGRHHFIQDSEVGAVITTSLSTEDSRTKKKIVSHTPIKPLSRAH